MFTPAENHDTTPMHPCACLSQRPIMAFDASVKKHHAPIKTQNAPFKTRNAPYKTRNYPFKMYTISFKTRRASYRGLIITNFRYPAKKLQARFSKKEFSA